MRWPAAPALLVVAAFACSGGEQANSGLDEPLQVTGGQFISGPLPGIPPVDAGADGGMAGAPPSSSSLAVTALSYHSGQIISGVAGKSISGFIGQDAVAVGVRFADIGTGYWVVPVQGFEATEPGQRDFGFTANFNPDAPIGLHPLVFVGIASDGTGGPQYPQDFCIQSRVPDNDHACNPAQAVPPVVFTLRWDTAFDVDLHVILPDFTDINAKFDPDIGDGGLPTATTSRIDRDSMGNCVADAWREEDLVFETPPAPGLYDIYADPYAACGQSAVHFTFVIYKAGPDGNLHASYSQSGELLSSQVTGGKSTGLFVYETSF